MLTELRGKGGRICQSALDGTLRCPLIVRPTSEDVVTGNLFGSLGAINPRWWLPALLNQGLKTDRFRTQVYRNFKIELWKKQPAMPRHLVPWEEGQTEVDVAISWGNPATTVFLEMKFRSDLSANTSHNSGADGFPADQLIRNARIGLWRSGWYEESRLFAAQRRDFALLLVNGTGTHPLVEAYRDTIRLRRAIPKSHLLPSLPRSPFVGCLGYAEIAETLKRQRQWMQRSEQLLVDQLAEYLEYKLGQMNAPVG
ncbi:hypothetical protein [Lacipirellula sp.]|uniref:hypothetical protein n=1 Tax=Lacipirellula sp. TaxID=2691419 RepID=UPI003D13E0CF